MPLSQLISTTPNCTHKGCFPCHLLCASVSPSDKEARSHSTLLALPGADVLSLKCSQPCHSKAWEERAVLSGGLQVGATCQRVREYPESGLTAGWELLQEML